MTTPLGNYQTHLVMTLQAVSATVIAAAQTLAGAGNMVLASTATTDGLNHNITLTSTGALSGVNFTITGKDAQGIAVTEVLAGPSNNTVTSVKAYATITSIAASGAVGTNTSAGISGVATSRYIPIENRAGSWNVGIAVDLGGGTSTFDVDVTYDDIYAQYDSVPWQQSPASLTWFTPTAFSAKSANTDGALSQPCTAVRFRTESYTGTPTIKCHIIQNKP